MGSSHSFWRPKETNRHGLVVDIISPKKRDGIPRLYHSARSSSREARIRVPTFSRGTLPTKKGEKGHYWET